MMNDLATNIVCRKDVGLLKWSCVLFCIAVGIYLAEEVRPYLLLVLMLTVAFAVKPAVAYFRN